MDSLLMSWVDPAGGLGRVFPASGQFAHAPTFALSSAVEAEVRREDVHFTRIGAGGADDEKDRDYAERTGRKTRPCGGRDETRSA